MPLPPKSTTAYDPNKAAAFNQLRQQGLSESDAASQAGITKAEQKHYQLNYVGSNDPKSPSYNPNYGKMGPQVMGENEQLYNNALKSGKSEQEAYAVLQQKKAQEADDRKFAKEQEAFLDGKEGKKTNFDDPNADDEFETGSVATNARTPPGGKVSLNSQTTTTDTVSGGGSVTRIAGRKVDNAASTAKQKEADAKQAELDKYYDDNPDPQERAAQGLPPLSPQQEAARKAEINRLSAEKTALENQASDLKTSTPGSTIVVPNTTTTQTTVTNELTAEKTPVSAPTGADPIVNQQAGTQLVNNYTAPGSIQPAAVNVIPGGGQITDPNAPDYNATYAEYVRESQADPVVENSAATPTADPYPPAGAGRGFVNPAQVQPDAVPAENVETFRPGESTVTAVDQAPGQTYYESGGGGGNQGTITRVTTEPQVVADDTLPQPTGGNESTVNIGTDDNRGGNLEAATREKAQQQAAIQAQFQSPASGDWRVRLRLAPQATYLYKDASNTLLAPLLASDGVVFPYMPTIQTSYNANYDTADLTHSNYRGYFYKNSYVGDITLNGVFTAQDTVEANYLLAVIHFFRSVTKMFYGQDAERGAPPPLVYLIGLGQYQFNNQPCVVSNFTYSLPTDVDYIRTKPNNYNINLGPRQTKTDNGPFGQISAIIDRLKNAALPRGAVRQLPDQSLVSAQSVTNIDNNTYVPTRMEIQLTLKPMQTRNQQSQQFSVKEFANGNLLKGGFW